MINSEPVEIVESIKYLGLTLDNKLNFDKHTTDTNTANKDSLPSANLKLFLLPPNFYYYSIKA